MLHKHFCQVVHCDFFYSFLFLYNWTQACLIDIAVNNASPWKCARQHKGHACCLCVMMAHLGTTAEAAGLKMELCHPKECRTKDMLVYQKKTNNRQNQTSLLASYTPHAWMSHLQHAVYDFWCISRKHMDRAWSKLICAIDFVCSTFLSFIWLWLALFLSFYLPKYWVWHSSC